MEKHPRPSHGVTPPLQDEWTDKALNPDGPTCTHTRKRAHKHTHAHIHTCIWMSRTQTTGGKLDAWTELVNKKTIQNKQMHPHTEWDADKQTGRQMDSLKLTDTF